MSKYRITLEGRTYEMEVELVPEEVPSRPAARSDYKEYKGAPKDPTIRVIDPSAQRMTTSTAGSVTAPMPGTVVRLEKAEGDTVSAGELVLVLEAMKMENEILAPSDGTIKTMKCAVGDAVAGGEILFEVE